MNESDLKRMPQRQTRLALAIMSAPARALPWAAVLLLGACAQIQPNLPAPMRPSTTTSPSGVLSGREGGPPEMRVTPAPAPPVAAAPAGEATLPSDPAAGEVVAAVNLQQIPLPTFVQLVYSEILKKNVNLHPAVTARQDLVTFRTGGGQTAAQIERAVQLLLKTYSISAIDVGGLVRVVPDNAALGNLPTIRYGAASPDVPLPLRPVFHLVTLQSVRQTDVTNWVRTMFAERVTVQEDAGRNAVLLRGNPDDVKAALDAINTLDQPAMKGRASLALTPAFWSSEELARRLAEILGAEGYAVHPVGQVVTPGAARYPVILLPVAALNAVYVFASSDTVANHVANWARTLDKPNERGIGKNFFTYAVKHKDAELLGQTLDRILGGSGGGNTANAAANANAGATGQQSTTANSTQRLGSVVVDKSTNVLIFQAKPDEYGQITSLLQTLDRPTKAALIEVTVAELSVDDSKALGVEWLSSHVDGNGSIQVNTQGGAALGTAGLNLRVFNGAGALRLALNALASDNRATILSSPRLMARNGEAATIQVGQEVPIITSQQTTTGTVTPPNQAAILQTVQYRSTGVILKIKPVIHSGDQVDLDVTQEVSEAGRTETGVASSPTFQTRKVDTKLTLRNGSTVLLGGLISESGNQGSAGVPFLKDIPVVGSFFSKQSGSGVRRELIVLITPYIANDSHDAEAITDAFRKSLGSWANGLKSGAESPPQPAPVGAPAPVNPPQR